jgi:Na+-translocating ferredoxin:NAD+ oxidoreductase subunit D
VDAVTAATPLGLMKFEREIGPTLPLIVGNTGGSLGETAAS